MAEKVLKTTDIGGVVKEKESDTSTVIIQNEDTLRADLQYLGQKLGVDIDALQKERIAKEKQARESKTDARLEKKIRARQAAEAALDKDFLDHYGYGEKGHYLITLGGKRIARLKDFGDIKCPVCNETLPAVHGFAHSIMEQPELMETPGNPLAAIYYTPLRIDSAKCANGHTTEVMVQRIL